MISMYTKYKFLWTSILLFALGRTIDLNKVIEFIDLFCGIGGFHQVYNRNTIYILYIRLIFYIHRMVNIICAP